VGALNAHHSPFFFPPSSSHTPLAAQVPDWARNMLANRLATDGPSWVQYFSQFNSGTYSNQWMVWDTKLFAPGQPLADNTLVVLEQVRASEDRGSAVAAQWVATGRPGSRCVCKLSTRDLAPFPHVVSLPAQMPGIIEWSDHTPWLRAEAGGQGYWASYNRPSFPHIFEVSNQSALVAAYGDHFSWNNTARAQIFRRNQSAVVDGPTYERLLRYNDFQHDPVSTQGCPAGGRSGSNAISERGDLTPAGNGCLPTLAQFDEGSVDGKYTTWSALRAGTLAVRAQSGPTFDTQPPFVWSTSPFADIPHVGQPDKWAFPWVDFEFDL
jgi:hypothetical protein